MAMESTRHTLMGGDPGNTNMQLAHGTLLNDGRSFDSREYQRGDPVAIVDDGARESLVDAIQILNLRSNEYMLVLLKAVCWVPTHSEQRSGTTFLLTLYGPNLDFRHSDTEPPQMGYRGIATIFGSCVYVGREVVLEGNLSRVNLDPANRVSLFTAQWDALSVHSELQQPVLTPSASSCASSRSPSESGADSPPPRFYRLQGRRDSAIEIRDPESPIYKSSTGRKSISPKPLFARTASFVAKYNNRMAAETRSPKHVQYESNTPAWSDLGSDDDFGFNVDAAFGFDPTFPDNLDLCINESQFGDMMADNDLQVNFVFMPQNESDNFASGHPEQQRADGNVQEPLWPTHNIPGGPENSWDPLQMPPQHASEMRQQQQLPMPQRQQQMPTRQGGQADYYEPYRLTEDQSSSHMHSGAATHHSHQPEASHMSNDPRAGYAPSQQSPTAAPQPTQGFQMQSRYSEQSSRLPAPGAPTSSFPTQEVHIIQSNRHDPRQPHSLASNSYSPVHEGTLPSSSHTQHPRRSPLPEESRASSARGTPVMARRAPSQSVHTFSPTGLIDSFRQSAQAHTSTLESLYEQLQQNPTGDDQLRRAGAALQAVRRTTDDSLQLLNLLQPITGIPLKGTEKRLKSLADQIVDTMKELLPNASEASEQHAQKMGQKVQNLKDFIEYVEGVHPEVVKRLQDSAAGTTASEKMKNTSVTAAGRVPSAPASVSSQAADESDSCRWVDGQATPPPDRSSAMAQNRDRSRMFRDMTNAHGRRPEPRVNTGSDFYPPTSYSQPTSRIHSPMASHAAPAEPQHPGGHGFYQQSVPTPLQQTMQMPDFGAPMQSRPMQAYPPPSSVEMMRPMQPVPSMPPQHHYTTQQEASFYLRPNPPHGLYPVSGAEMSQAAYAPRSPLSFQPGPAPAHPGYYQDVRSTLPDRRTVRHQERPGPYSLNYRDQRRRRGSQ